MARDARTWFELVLESSNFALLAVLSGKARLRTRSS